MASKLSVRHSTVTDHGPEVLCQDSNAQEEGEDAKVSDTVGCIYAIRKLIYTNALMSSLPLNFINNAFNQHNDFI